MKALTFVVALAGVIAVLSLVVERTRDVEPVEPHRGSAFPSDAMEGTAENPLARLEYDWERLHDPATGQIPPGIAGKELSYAHRLAGATTSIPSLTVDDDWVARGPYNVGGRTRALAIDADDEDNILAGSTSSGIFKSADGGNSWVKTTAPNQLHSLTSVVQNKAPGKGHIWYYGTGDRSPEGIANSAIGQFGTNSFYRGDGIFKSTDGGNSWTHLESTASGSPDKTDDFDFIWNLATFGDDGLMAATSTGLYKSIDGGGSWSPSLNLGDEEEYPSSEIEITAGGTFYATIGGAGPEHGVYRSLDVGQSWEDITPDDWPDATLRTVLAPAPSNEDAVYFFTEVTYSQKQLRKYVDGVGWTDLTNALPFNAQLNTYGGALMVLEVKPDDEDTVFLGGIDLFRSTDGGHSFELISGHGGNFHVDQTSIAFYPSNPVRMIVGNDGGLFRADDNVEATVNESLNWESLNNGYVTTQFYTVAIDHGTPGSEVLVGGTQDHGVMYTDSPNPTDPWRHLSGADGGQAAIADGGDYIVFALASTFRIYRQMGQQRTEITPEGVPLGLWLTLLQLDPHDQKIMYVPSQQALWRNSDLTGIPHQDGGGKTTVNWDSFENVKDHYIHSMGMSPAEPRRLYYAAADVSSEADGRVFYLENPHQGQPVPVDITSEDFPYFPYVPNINCIAVDPGDANKVVVVFPSYGVLSMFATEDGGQTWAPVSGNLEENPDGTGSGPSVRWLSILYIGDQPVYLAGTSVGLFSSIELDGMNTVWRPEATTSIGNVVIDMIDVRQSDGFTAVATHGNGVYTTYITTVPTSTEDGTEQPLAFEISSAYPNPFRSTATIQFHLPRAGDVLVAVFDVNGRKIETLYQGLQQAGRGELRWTPSNDVADGVYFVRATFEGATGVQKLVLER